MQSRHVLYTSIPIGTVVDLVSCETYTERDTLTNLVIVGKQESDREGITLPQLLMLYGTCAGWRNIEPWRCASRGCCYDVDTPQTVGDKNAKVSQPECYALNTGPSNYDLATISTTAG